MYNIFRVIIHDSEISIKLRKYMEIYVCKYCKWNCVFKKGGGGFKFLLGCFIERHTEELAKKIIDENSK